MKKLRKGLTLIEILVVIALIAVISSVVVINNKRGDKFKIESTTEKLLSDIKMVRNMAASKTTMADIYVAGENSFPKGGYGIEKYSPNSYYIYAYPNANNTDNSNNVDNLIHSYKLIHNRKNFFIDNDRTDDGKKLVNIDNLLLAFNKLFSDVKKEETGLFSSMYI